MKTYTLQEFYCYLKLGIWMSGTVEGWGFVQRVRVYPDGMTDKGCFVSKMPNQYKDELRQSKQQLSIGLQLLNLYPLEEQQTSKYNNTYKIYTYLAVVSQCILRGAYEEQICYLKITNNEPITIFRTKMYDLAQMGISSSPGRSRRGYKRRRNKYVERIDLSPINSIPRKY